MDLESIKNGFYAYLLGLKEIDSDGNNKYENVNFSEVSIFLYQDEFKDYLQDEFNISSADLKKGINYILNMEVVGKKLVETEESKKKDEQAGKSDIEGNNSENTDVPAAIAASDEPADENGEAVAAPTDGAEAATEGALPDAGTDITEGENSEQITLIDLFNALLEDENIANAVDNNQDGEFSKEEIMEFLNHINSIDGDEENLSLDDLLGALDETNVHNGEIEGAEETGTKEPGNAVSGSGGAYGGGGGTITREKTLDNMTREELQSELSTAEQKLADNQTILTDAISGNTPELLQLQNNIENAYNTYLDELKLVDEDMAKDLDNIVKDIESKEDEITEKELEIADQENTVSDAEGAYNNAVSTRESLENQLGMLKTALGEETDEAKKAEIQSAIDSVITQIEDAKRAEKDAKDTWDAEKDKLDDLNDEKDLLEDDLETLKSSKTELEGQIDEKYPEVSEYKNAYNEAKSSYDTAKTKAIDDAKAKVSESQKYVNDVKSALNDRDNKDLAKENLKSISGFSQYNEEKGKALAEMALKLYGNDHYANGNCAGGVADIIQATFGYRTHGNGCDYATELANYPNDWLNVTDEIQSIEDLRNLPAGAVVSWSTYEPGHTPSNGRYGHVWMSDGNGNEISDFIASVNLNYASWGASFTVYIPV